MKLKILLIVLGLSALNCQDKTVKKKDLAPHTQKIFNQYLKNSCTEFQKLNNEILKDELKKKVSKDIVVLADSIGIFDNWIGKLSKLDVQSFNGMSWVDVEISNLRETPNLTKYKAVVPIYNKSNDSNYVYNYLKGFSKGNIVRFSGIFCHKNNNELEIGKSTFSISDQDFYCQPEVEIRLISITEDVLVFEHPIEMDSIKRAQIDIWKQMTKSLTDRNAKRTLSRYLKNSNDRIKGLVDSLNILEREYIHNVTDALSSEFLK